MSFKSLAKACKIKSLAKKNEDPSDIILLPKYVKS